jgi:hypothetical protein
MIPIVQCDFIKAWIGRCSKLSVKGEDYCSEHLPLRCVSCGAKADHNCDVAGSLVCGANLCPNCCHAGYGGVEGMFGHGKRKP